MKLSNDRNIRVENVLYVPDLDKRLLSILAMNEKGLKVVFGQATAARSGKRFIINRQINEHAFIGKEKKEMVLVNKHGMPDLDIVRNKN